MLVENQECNIFENNLIYKWNVSFYIAKFKNDEFVWVKTSEKSVELYAEIIDYQQIVTEEVKSEEVKPEEVKVEEVKVEEVKPEEAEIDKASKDNNILENNQQIVKEYNETISKWNEDLLMLIANKASNTVEDLIYEIRDNGSFQFDNIDEQVLKTSSIKVKDVNTQDYLQETAYLSAAKYIVEIEFTIGNEDTQANGIASFEIKISDYVAQENSKFIGSENSQNFENEEDNSDPKMTPSNNLNDSGFESDLDEKSNANEPNHNAHIESDSEDIIEPSSSNVEIFTVYVYKKTKVEEVIAKIKEKYPLLSNTNIGLKYRGKLVKLTNDIKFTNYHVYQEQNKTTPILNLQVEELVLTSDNEQTDSVFNIFDIKLDKLMANHCTANDLKEMIKWTDKFKALKAKIKNKKVLGIKIKDKAMNVIEDKTNLLHDQYHVKILVELVESNAKANITFKVDVSTLSHELSSQLEKYISAIKSTVVKISTKKESTEDKTKCEAKIKDSEEIKNIFKADKKVVVKSVEIQQQPLYSKGATYQAKITFCLDKYENASRQQVVFDFIVE